MTKSKRNIAVAGFLLLAAVFFFVRGWFVAVPTLYAALIAAAASRKGGVAIPLALLSSAVGDYAGSAGNFIMQVAFFAIAHICYICDFAPLRHATRSRMVGATALAVVALCYLGFVMAHIEQHIEFVAVAIYGLIIYTMGATAIFQQRKHYGWYILSAMLFILSDSILVYGKYIATIPYGSIWIMVTYYAAQGLFMTLHMMRHAPQE